MELRALVGVDEEWRMIVTNNKMVNPYDHSVVESQGFEALVTMLNVSFELERK